MRRTILYGLLICGLVGVVAILMPLSPFAADQKPAVAKNAPKTAAAWSERCNKEKSHCEVYQSIWTKEPKLRLIDLALGYGKGDSKKPALVAILPLGVKLEPGVALKLTGIDLFKLPFKSCDQNGCLAAAVLPDPFFAALKKQDEMGVFVIDAAGKTIQIRMTLAGFSSALDKLSKN